ncbi:hypothetical protein [Winogradskyella luteola]|uniref:Uncharacterized protein n=1 Tax=Winogradskyella luteola TaxID=2828330 RepID=A0A9X1JQN5_9FLAO|nr:hypothetical protein [Winogradskyella luteola]MBV7267772.1 hypothetical protein [Winogradskyella luteola]
MTKNSSKKVIFEFFSITFAVILGFLVNQWNENRKNTNLAEQSLERIIIEVKENQEKIAQKLTDHNETLALIRAIKKSVENNTAPTDDSVSFSFEFTNSSAWETAKLTEAISYMPLEKVSELSMVYDLQSYYERFFKDYTLGQALNPNKNEDLEQVDILNQLEKTVQNAIGIEENLNNAYLNLLDNIG